MNKVLRQPIHQKTHSGTPKSGKRGKQRKYCQFLTPPLTRVHNLEVAAQYSRVRITEAIAPTTKVDTSDPKVEASDPRVHKPLSQSHLQKDDAPEPIDRCTHSDHPQPFRVTTEPIVQCTHSHTANLVFPERASVHCYPRQFILNWAMPVLDKETGLSL